MGFDDTRSDWVLGIAGLGVGIGVLMMGLFPLAIPIVVLTIAAILPLAIPVIALGVLLRPSPRRGSSPGPPLAAWRG